MGLSMLASGVLGLLAAAAPDFATLLVVRALQGAALAGVPAVGMAYLAEEIDHASLGASIGLYIAGNALGGMAGRLIGGEAAAHGWRAALAAVAVLSLACATAFWRLAPPSRHHVRSRFAPGPALASLTVHLHDRGQLRLDAIGALLMGTFVAVYNAVGFRLEAAPYRLDEAAVAAIFLVYPIGSLSSTVAGRLADRFGRRRVLPPGVLIAAAGVAVTALRPLPLVVLGIALLTIGFFAAHSVASSWVGRRAHTAPAQASALYLLAYYAGSSVAGPLGGAAWDAGRWPEVMTLAGVLLGTSLLVALRLRRTPPLVPPAAGRPSAATPAA
jgi:YNFM family putative membrane transporter